MNYKKLIYTVVCILLCSFVGLLAFRLYENVVLKVSLAHEGYFKTDSAFTNKEYKIKVIHDIQKPNKVLVYNKPDTVLRKKIEHDTIIAGVTVTDKQISIERITPKGIALIDTYNINHDYIKSSQINNKGQLQLTYKKPFWIFCKKQLKWIVPVGCVIIGGVAGVILSK